MPFAQWSHGGTNGVDGIFVENSDPAFFKACCSDLTAISKNDVGKELLKQISARVKQRALQLNKGIGTTTGRSILRVEIQYTNEGLCTSIRRA